MPINRRLRELLISILRLIGESFYRWLQEHYSQRRR